eukprot:GSMAST32.ASY1.ANO1.211.1 assembled CDS
MVLYTRHMIVTWLILPVVIRSSQRLSHACVIIVYLIIPYYLDNRSNSRANTCIKFSSSGGDAPLVSHNNCADRRGLCAGDESFKFLPYQLSMVVYWTTMAVTGNGELGFDSGEGA